MSRMLKSVLSGLLALLLVLGLYVLWMGYDVGRLRALCNAIQPGQTLTEVAGQVKQTGFDAPALRGGVATGGTDADQRTLLIPAPATMGETVCKIDVQDGRVLSARMNGPQE